MSRSRHSYGPHRLQVADLWLPEPRSNWRPHPVLVLIHGGWWRSRYTRSLMDRLAQAATAVGWAAWNVEYRRVGRFGGGGGFPSTLSDVADAIDHLSRLDEEGIDTAEVVTCGHSAGGHLALWAAARHRSAGIAGPQLVRPRAAISLAGAVDLAKAASLGLGSGAVEAFLGVDAFETRCAQASPAALLPLGVPQLVVQGMDDDTIPVSLGEGYYQAARAAGDELSYEVLAGVGHMDMIDPCKPPWELVVAYLESLLAT